MPSRQDPEPRIPVRASYLRHMRFEIATLRRAETNRRHPNRSMLLRMTPEERRAYQREWYARKAFQIGHNNLVHRYLAGCNIRQSTLDKYGYEGLHEIEALVSAAEECLDDDAEATNNNTEPGSESEED
jgi:hypothetical protein